VPLFGLRLKSIMLQNLPIMLSGISFFLAYYSQNYAHCSYYSPNYAHLFTHYNTVIQVLATELVLLAVDFVPLANEFILLANEFSPLAIEFVALAFEFVTLAQKFVRNKICSCSEHENKMYRCSSCVIILFKYNCCKQLLKRR